LVLLFEIYLHLEKLYYVASVKVLSNRHAFWFLYQDFSAPDLLMNIFPGVYCAAKSILDDTWYRAQVIGTSSPSSSQEKVLGKSCINLL